MQCRILFKGNVEYGVNEETPQVDPNDNQIDHVYKVKNYLAFDPDIPWDKMEPILGMRYETPQQLKMALANYGVAHGYQLWYMKNDWRQGGEGNQASKKPIKKPVKKDVKKPVNKKPDSQFGEGTSQSPKWTKKHILNSKKVNCPFRLYASRMSRENSFQINSLRSEHKCCRNYNLGSLVTYKWISMQYFKEIIEDPFMPLRKIRDDIRQKFMIDRRQLFKGVKDGWLAGCRKAAASYTLEQQFLQIMDQIKLLDANVYDYLIHRNPNSWSRAFFEMDMRCTTFENGISKSFNRAILGWIVFPSGFQKLEVRKGDQSYGVSLQHKVCQCRMWELSGVPCVHAVTTYMNVGSDLDAGVSYWYSRESWFNAYQFSIKPVFGTNMWKRTNDVPPLPPIIRKMPVRPQKNRIKAPSETSGSQQVFVGQCASRGGGRSGRGNGNDGSGSGSGVIGGTGSGSAVNDGTGSGGRGGSRAGVKGKRGGRRGGRGSGRGSRGGVFPSSSSCGILTAKEQEESIEEAPMNQQYHEVLISSIHSQPTQQSRVLVVDTTVSVVDVDEAPKQETIDDGPAPEQGKSPAMDKGKAKASVEDGPAPKKKRGRPPLSVDGIRIYHKNRGRSERIANMKRSNVDEVLGRQWDRVNAVVLGWILNSITEELFLGQIFSKRARHVWEELRETYDKVDGSVTFNLHHKIHTMKQNGSTLADYYHNLNALWKQFDCLVELPRCTCHAAADFKKHNQLMKLMQFLMGLDDSYMSIRSSILSRDPLPDVRNAYATISSEESHRVIASSMSDSSQRTQTAAFASNAPNRTVFQRGQSSNSSFRPNNFTNPGPRPNNNNQSRQNGGSGLVCENCGFNGHTIDRCFKLIGYPADFGKKRNGQNSKGKSVSNNSVSGSSSSSGFTDEQLSTLISLIKDNSVSGKSVQANMAGTIFNNSKVFNDNFDKFFCSNANLKSKLVGSRKIIDSGANQHMTDSDKGLYNIHDISHLKIKVGHPNGTETFISKIGTLKLKNGLILYDVLVIPEYCVTLISVHKLAKDNKIFVAFDESMNCNKNDSFVKSCLSQHDWHCRLGHPADPVLSVLKPDLKIDNTKQTEYCETCQRAKQTRESFPLSDHTSSSLGDLVHLDLWGPYKVTSPEGFKYFLTVVDDYSRAVWLYLIKTKDEVSFYLTLFYNLIENQFNKRIKIFRSDNGTEFVNQTVMKFCVEKGIIHQTSCAYSPQQNGIAERKHRHLLNVARSLLFQGGIPLRFWTECVLTATYLINRLPSSVLNGKSPFELIYNTKPNLSNLRVFGCLCFATVLNNHDKLGSRSEKCVMMGYSSVKKGYSSDSSHSHVSGDNDDIIDIPDSGVETDNNGHNHATHDEQYGLEKFVGYANLDDENLCFVTELNKSHEPKTFLEASRYPHWADAMNKEMEALLRNDTWELVELPKNRKAISSKWLWKIKYKSNGEIERYKARLVALGCNQEKGIDYEETFSPVVKMVTVRCLMNIAVLNDWPMFQLDIDNAFLYGDLDETVYMKPPQGYYDTECNKVCRLKKSLYGLKQAPRQWNAKLTACKPARTPMISKLSVSNEESESDPLLDNVVDYQKLMGKLIYLTNTRPDISYVVHCLSQFMHAPLMSHLRSAFKILRYLKGSPGLGIHVTKTSVCSQAYSDADWAKCVVTRKSVTGYYVFINDNLISWKSKKQNTISKSSSEAEYRALASVTSEIIWILKVLKDVGLNILLPVFFISVIILKGIVKTFKVDSANQIADILTKGLDTIQHDKLVKDLGMINLYQI
ncbi:putative RNA-directed DNA polymerase [Tanacetum coccineum]|uniref:RNA-directed DNA polymerase n=1 Tax=Tanacetum coccineum TaxID=301880 RepID=A0ABQ4Z8D9_9ASTR